jgi:uncharacterized protein (TIGR04222 family)
VNPFDLRGPEFLLFYTLFAGAVFAVLYRMRGAGSKGGPKPQIEDPYLVAFLRGGAPEALRVATLSLMDRGLLAIRSSGSSSPFFVEAENRLEIASAQAIDSVRRPIEKQILEAFKEPKRIGTTLENLERCAASREYENKLEQTGLWHTQESRDAFQFRQKIAVYILLGVAVLKIFIAIARGHSNILFLIILAGVAVYCAARIGNPIRTARGDKFLQDVKTLFANLQLRASTLRPGGSTADLAWLASAYGLAAVPTGVFPHASALKPPPRAQDFASGGSSSDGSWFSSCGSSSCGGGCGGGSCGGGCGGCGS